MCPAYVQDSHLPGPTDGALNRTAELLAKLLSGSEDPDVRALSGAVKVKFGITEPLPKPALASPSPGLSTVADDLKRSRVSRLLPKVTCTSPSHPPARTVPIAELQDMPVTETEKKGLTALAPLDGVPSPPSGLTQGGGRGGETIPHANIQLELPEFDPKNLPKWAEEFAEFLLLTGQSHVDVATKCSLLKRSCKKEPVLPGPRVSKDWRKLSRSTKQTSVYAHRLRSSLCSLIFLRVQESLNMCATRSICSHE